MAMNGDQLGKEIMNALIASNASDEAKAAVLATMKKLGNAIVNHIKNNAVVPAGILVSSGDTTSSPGRIE